jgi:all-trans-retinol 13,14-reductase
VYVTAASPVEGTPGRGFIAVRPMSPEQTEVWRDSLTGSRPATYEAFKREAAEAVLGRLRAFCPEVEGSLSCIEAATPLTMRDYNHTPTGSLYGVKHMVGQRNPTTQTRVRELLLAGQAVAAPGVLGAMISGFLACGAILGHDRLRKELLACRDGGLS